jgi:hypothetical protein
MTSSIALPGFATPAASLDEPFDLLDACHARAKHHLRMLLRLRAHLGEHGWDRDANDAWCAVRRYFTVAAPLHYEDEELHIFPKLRLHSDPSVQKIVDDLIDDHRRFHELWNRICGSMDQWCTGSHGQAHNIAPPSIDALFEEFDRLHAEHIQREETFVLPIARKSRTPGKAGGLILLAPRRGQKVVSPEGDLRLST